MILDSGYSEDLVFNEGAFVATADNYAFSKPFVEYSVSELMLTLIFVILLVKLVLNLFMRKWGFFDW